MTRAIETLDPLSPAQQSQFRALEGLYNEWNAKINVISRKDMDGLYLHHVLHSLCIAAFLKMERPQVLERWQAGVSVLDLGTGGGFPGIPLAILFPRCRFTLCDSIGKKVKVATEVSSALGLDNVETVNARAESLGREFDHVVSRAVTSLENFYPWVKGRYRGSILYLKGGDVAEETAALMASFKLPKGSVSTWKIAQWQENPWFEGKFVVEIGK
ncbi:MAG: 16S rRNA (guanine(527)-N(7))-methyltransferase RsmG [Bacteroidales bacterium]|nr:16S rRNA (guanine(527)-N(7))-methyltransferase RsmG [Bacteroidales bacterium]